MAAEKDRELRRLAKTHRISFKPPVPSKAKWPSKYRTTFDNIKKIGEYSFENYAASIDPLSDQQPWKKRTKHRAKWLAERACHLIQQQRNEAGWRFNIENDVLRRFSVEVACPGCRARLWRSELEAAVEVSDDVSKELERRRKDRRPCQCPPEKRPQDYYEMGTNPLFDDRVQEVIVHNPLLPSKLPRQEPDRVYGLRETSNFKDLLSKPVFQSSNALSKSIGDSVESCPFRDRSDPLLFPFLILEAKSEKSSNGFDAISSQTAFPILALLRLQEGLARQVEDESLDGGPLAWFFASRGDVWRVYGCYVTEDHPPRYDILQLWDGSILSNDKALQLILIVDYIFDWARDIYRPSILRQLKSLTSNNPYDKISIANDSDIHSMRRKISSWIPPPQDTTDLTREESEPVKDFSLTEALSDHENRLLRLSADSFRSPASTTARMVGLHLTESNSRSLLQWAGANDYNNNVSRTACRTLINFVTQWDDLLLMTNNDLIDFESSWTGSSCAVNEPPRSGESANVADTYVLLEYATYMDDSWRIVCEITYLAVSKGAFEILVEYADFNRKHNGISSISENVRPCSADVLEEAVHCVRSGSIQQIFLAAVSCSCFALFPLPEKAGLEQGHPTLALGLARLPHSRLRGVVAKYHAYGLPQVSKGLNSKRQKRMEQDELHKLEGQHNTERPGSIQADRSFIHVSERKKDISGNPGHDFEVCDRCCRSKTDVCPFPRVEQNPFAEYGMAIVTALAFNSARDGEDEFCLFAQDLPERIINKVGGSLATWKAIAPMLEDVLQSGKVYQTIQHPLPNSFTKANSHYEIRWDSVVWNLPLAKHLFTEEQRHACHRWIRMLSSISYSIQSHEIRDTWNALQMTLFLLKEGQTPEQAVKTVEKHRAAVKASMERNAKLRGSKKANGILDMRIRLYELYTDKTREISDERKAEGGTKPRAYMPAQQRDSNNKLRWQDVDVSEYDGCIFNFLRS